jgi:hypothetical protein
MIVDQLICATQPLEVRKNYLRVVADTITLLTLHVSVFVDASSFPTLTLKYIDRLGHY